MARYLGRELQVLVTPPIIRETESRALPRIADYLWRRARDLYGVQSEEELLRLLRDTLEDALAEDIIVDVVGSGAYRRQLLAVVNRPSRRILTRLSGQLVLCVRVIACREQTRMRDLHVASSLALVYDVAVAVPLATRAGVSEGTLVLVTGDRDLYCSLRACLQNLGIGYVLVRPYGWLKHRLAAWAAEALLEEKPEDPRAAQLFAAERHAAEKALRDYEEWCEKRWCGVHREGLASH